MLFNSLEFILIFLPLTWALWRLIISFWSLRPALAVLVLGSLIFYGYWDIRYVPGLIVSIIINFYLGQRIISERSAGKMRRAQIFLLTGVILDLGVLGIFKYAHFIATNLTFLGLPAPSWTPLVLPLGISFITFQQIAYLVDCRRGAVDDRSLLNYFAFITFFPQLIAGPIVHHRPFIAQLNPANQQLWSGDYWAQGLTLFALGLFKKVVLADTLASYANPAFAAASIGSISGGLAWQGMLAYSLQLYFDFAGYSDMALGLGLLFGLRLPLNFDSPYRASSIRSFWRRWHISLSHFLRDYVYIPLGGNRVGPGRHICNLMVTMLLGGLWHGAGWTFILWGGWHGLLLVLETGWRQLIASRPKLQAWIDMIPKPLWLLLTFISVALGWVLFRSPDLATAGRIYQGLLDGNGLISTLQSAPWQPTAGFWQAWLAAEPTLGWAWIALGLMIVWGLPNSWRWVGYDPEQTMAPKLGFYHGLVAGLCLWAVLKTLLSAPASEFLYFNF